MFIALVILTVIVTVAMFFSTKWIIEYPGIFAFLFALFVILLFIIGLTQKSLGIQTL